MRVLPCVVVCGVLLSEVAAAQSLAEIARQEDARRKGVVEAPKVYTNKDLKPAQAPVPAGAPASPPATPPEGTGKEAVAGDEPSKEPPAKAPAKPATEDAWRGRMKALTDSAERDRLLLDALQARVNALTSDATNRDDPAQRAVLTAERMKALAEMDRLKKALADDKTAATALEEEARRAGVPPGWLR